MIIHLYFHSNSLSEPSQSVETTVRWPTWRCTIHMVVDMEVDMVASRLIHCIFHIYPDIISHELSVVSSAAAAVHTI